MSRRPGPVVFVHAHPDDEAIFTGGTMVRLVEAGVDVALVVATGGELGTTPGGPDAAALAAVRRAETERAAELLGVSAVEFLGYTDSGMAGEATNHAPGSFWSTPVDDAADRLADVLAQLGATIVVGYDEDGVYGHPDHIQVTRVARAAADRAGLASVYGATVDREYLHFVESHLVEEAAFGGDLGLVRSHIGVASVELSTTVDVRSAIEVKRAAMATHISQIPEEGRALRLPDQHFTEVYGWEWYVRWGPPSLIDGL